PAISLLYALDEQLLAIDREGIEQRWKRHAAMRATVDEWTAKRGLAILAPRGSRSPTVSAIVVPEGETLTKAVAKRGFVIGGGYGSLRKTSVRIGHMGDHTVEGLERCLAAIDDALVRA